MSLKSFILELDSQNTRLSALGFLNTRLWSHFLVPRTFAQERSRSSISLEILSGAHRVKPLATMLNFRREKSAESEVAAQQEAEAVAVAVDAPRQPFRKAIVPVIACGAGLFSDGYINNVSAHLYLRYPTRI